MSAKLPTFLVSLTQFLKSVTQFHSFLTFAEIIFVLKFCSQRRLSLSFKAELQQS